MPAKRPNLPTLAPPTVQESMKITDTMTLVVKDDHGGELRVGGSGYANKETPTSNSSLSQTTPKTENLMNNKIQFEDLKTMELLGAGSQGKVRKCIHKGTGEIFAVKSIAFNEDREATRAMVKGELNRIDALKHEAIVSSYQAFFREGKLYIVLEYMDCGTMTSVIKANRGLGIPEPILAYTAKCLLSGLHFLHSSNTIHRDMKPANLLVSSSGHVKISDFGVAKDFGNKNSAETLAAVGSTPYMSPERVKGEPYSYSCDIWSAGLTIAECAIGKYPFGALKNKIFELCQAIANNQCRVEWEAAGSRKFSPELVDFVNQCLRPVATRPTAKELLDHPFVQTAENLSVEAIGRWFAHPTGTEFSEAPPSANSASLVPLAGATTPLTAAPPSISSSLTAEDSMSGEPKRGGFPLDLPDSPAANEKQQNDE